MSIHDRLKQARRKAMERVAAQQAAPPPPPSIAQVKDGFVDASAAPRARGPQLNPAALPLGMDPIAGRAKVSVSAEEREAILDAAAALFGRGGFRRVSLEEVARHANVTRAHVIAVCASKEDLLFLATEKQVEAFLAEGRVWLDRSLDPPELLRVVAQRSFERIGKSPLILQLMLLALPELSPADEARFLALRDRCRELLHEALLIGMEQGKIRKSLPPEQSASLLFDLHAASFLLYQQTTSDPSERAAQRRAVAIDILYNGLKA